MLVRHTTHFKHNTLFQFSTVLRQNWIRLFSRLGWSFCQLLILFEGKSLFGWFDKYNHSVYYFSFYKKHIRFASSVTDTKSRLTEALQILHIFQLEQAFVCIFQVKNAQSDMNKHSNKMFTFKSSPELFHYQICTDVKRFKCQIRLVLSSKIPLLSEYSVCFAA